MIAPELEPVAGACLAINLAYLGLARFRYRKQIRDAALEEHKQFGRNDDQFPENIKKLDHYAQLSALCGLSNHDYQKADGESADAKIRGTFRGWLYQVIYSHHLDRTLSHFCAAIAGLCLIAGVAASLKSTWFGILPIVFHEASGGWWLAGLSFASALPVGFVLLGRNIVHHVTKHAAFCREQIELSMQESTRLATIPESAGIPVRNIRPQIRFRDSRPVSKRDDF